jgi:hypothetical protein
MQPSYLTVEAARRANRAGHMHAGGSMGLLLRERAQDSARRPATLSLRGRIEMVLRTRYAG